MISPTLAFFYLVLTLILIQIHHYVCANDYRYANCSHTFDCSGHVNLTYPFWGSNRPSYCGHPEFELNCTKNNPLITIESVDYRVLELNHKQNTLVVARDDYWQSPCPTEFHNTTLDLSVFSFASDTQSLTLLYECPPPPSTLLSIPSLFSCDDWFNYFVTEAVRATIPSGVNAQTCDETIILRISNSLVARITTNTSLVPALRTGFGLTWKLKSSSYCDECLASGGYCGSDQNSSKFTCYCVDGPQTSKCSNITSSSGGGKTNASKIGLSIAGACILVIVIGCFVYFLTQRRKKHAMLAKDKNLITPPSSNNDPTSSTNLSQTIPSYFTSKSDIEKGSTYFGVQVFSYTELEEATDHFDPSKELGDGGFGTVYYGKLEDGRVVAVKRLYENNFKRVEQFMNEVEILTRLAHRNLVKLYGCTSRRSRELLLVYEYIPNGTVADHLHGKQAKSGLLTWQVRLSIAIETAEALAYLHHSDIIHRDVKTNNILLDNDFRVKVADFGLSRLFPNDVTHVSTAPQGTPGYVDPEYYQCYQLTDKSDVYSFGVVLIELISSLQAVDTNRHRHDINLASMAINKIQNHALNELVDPSLGFEKDNAVNKMATAVAELAFRCLQQEKDMRPTMEEVLVVLKAIKKEDFCTEKAEVVDIRSDVIGLLKGMPPPLSPDSDATDKLMMIGEHNTVKSTDGGKLIDF